MVFDLIRCFHLLTETLEIMEMTQTLVLGLIGFLGSWAIVLGKTCSIYKIYFLEVLQLSSSWNYLGKSILYYQVHTVYHPHLLLAIGWCSYCI